MIGSGLTHVRDQARDLERFVYRLDSEKECH